MPLEFSTILTDWLQGSSGGQLPLIYEQPWDPDQSTKIIPSVPELRADFRATVNSPGEEISLWLEAKDENTLKRFFACWLIATMPEKGMNETLRSLRDIHEFHRYVPPMLSSETKQEKLGGRLVSTKQRPGLIIGE
jgi:hypothetical protein